MEEAWLQPFQLIVTATSNLALAAIAGSFSALAILRSCESAWARARAESIAVVLHASIVINLCAAILGLWISAALIAELPLLQSVGSIGKILLETHTGRGWTVGTTALIVLLAMRPRRGRARNRSGLGAGAACALLFAASRSWSSHAGATGNMFAFVVDWAHLVSASVWAGMVGISATIALRGSLPQYFREKSDCAAFVQTLSDTATGSLAVLVLTGGLAAWRSLGGSWMPLVSSSYGVILLVKLVLVAGAVALGAHNRYAAMPALLALLRARNSTFSVPYRKFVQTLSTESRVLLAVLVLASMLSLSSPP